MSMPTIKCIFPWRGPCFATPLLAQLGQPPDHRCSFLPSDTPPVHYPFGALGGRPASMQLQPLHTRTALSLPCVDLLPSSYKQNDLTMCVHISNFQQ